MITDCKGCRFPPKTRPNTSGSKIKVSFMDEVRRVIKAPRNRESPTIDLAKYFQNYRRRQDFQDFVPESLPPSRLPTHQAKSRLETREHHRTIEDELTARFDQLPLQQSLKLLPQTRVTNSAFYKMKHQKELRIKGQSNILSRDKYMKKKVLDIGPIFNMVSKQVHSYRSNHQTSKSSKMYTETELLKPMSMSEFQSPFSPKSTKICVVQDLMGK